MKRSAVITAPAISKRQFLPITFFLVSVFYSASTLATPNEKMVSVITAPIPATKQTSNVEDDWCSASGSLDDSSGLHRLLHNRDRSCLITLAEMDKMSAKSDFSLVDVRSTEEFDKFRIAGSINIPLHLIKTKTFLKKFSVVMVNDGRSTAELENACRELRQSGFTRLAVLDRGLFGWSLSKRPVAGDTADQKKLNRTAPRELFEERAMADWSVIDISTPGKYEDMHRWLPGKVVKIPLAGKPKSKSDPVAQIASGIAQQRKLNPQSRLLLIADDEQASQRIEQQLQKNGHMSGVLRLDGGFEAYQKYVFDQQAIWREQNKPQGYAICRG